MSKIYDRIYIGSGPINLVDAYLRAKKGEKIAIIDSKTQVGGAWVAIPVGDYGRLEIGCHIWSYNRKVYDFLEKLTGSSLGRYEASALFPKWKFEDDLRS